VADYIEAFITWLNHHDVLTPFGETTMVRVHEELFQRYFTIGIKGQSLMIFCWYYCVLMMVSMGNARERFGGKV
jgi:hypothetical protein